MITFPDFGLDKIQSMNSIVSARRIPAPELSMWQKATTMFQKKNLPACLHYSLSTLQLQGFIPADFVEQGVSWEQLSHHTTASLLDFGFVWSDMIAMNFLPHHFKLLQWSHLQQLNIKSVHMLETVLSIHDLVALQLTPQQLHQMGWNWAQITEIGGTKDNINIAASDISIYFKDKQTESKLPVLSKFKF